MIPQKREQVTPIIVAELLAYNPDTGELFWRKRDRIWFKSDGVHKAWNARFSGKPAFTSICHYGYREGAIFNMTFKLHRVAAAIMDGEWPEVIDHIDGNPLNNVWDNLRTVDQSANMRNQKQHASNTSGVTGVTWDASKNKWAASIWLNNKRKHLGRFETLQEAASARSAANKENGFHQNHGRTA
jgi:hypothetical protein